MASLADYYKPPAAPNTAALQSAINLTASDARVDAGLAQSRLKSAYATRALPDLVNRYAARGTFSGGQARLQADRLKQDVANEQGDIQRQLNRTLATLRRQGVLATTGIGI
jgi:hypothetical protein